MYPLAGIMIAGTVLVKLANLPALLIFSIILLLLLKKFNSENQLISRAPHILAMVISVVLPIIIWCSLNLYKLGDLTGTSEKIRYFGWTVKSFDKLTDHPIFTTHGIVTFLSELTVSLWRGEFIWHLDRLASRSADAMYKFTTLFFVIAGIISIISNRKKVPANRNAFNYLHLCIVILYIFFLAILSLRYNFGTCSYPTNELPYFDSGRLLLASMLSFLILYVKGIEFLVATINKRINPMIVVILIVAYSAYSEIAITLAHGVFSSPYNFFHL